MLSVDTSSESTHQDIEEIITEDIVRGHLVEMGYGPDALPDSVLSEFVQELKILYKEELEFSAQEEKEILSKSKQKIIKQSKHDRAKKSKQAWEELDQQFSNLDLDGFRKTAIKQRDLISNCSSPVSVPPPSRQKRHDPVSRYHQHQTQWNKDGFLKRMNKSTVGSVGRWGGMAAVVVEEKKPRKINKPSDYVIPSKKDRRDTQYRYCIVNSDTPDTCEEPLAQLGEDFLYGFWQVVYWITFNIQMFIVPVMQGYVRSGGFTFKKRLYDGIMENIIFYAAIGVPSIGFLLYAIFGLNVPVYLMNNCRESLLDLAIPASNAYGLVLLALFMSFGLVEIPRGLWVSSNVQWKLRSLENEAPQLKEACVDAEAEVYEVARILGAASTKITNDDPLRPKLDRILELCPLALTERNGVVENSQDKFTEADLISLKARIVRANFLHVREQARLKILEAKAFFYQDIISNFNNKSQLFESPFLQVKDDQYKIFKLKAAWWWYVWIQPVSQKVLSVFCLVGTILILWSESTFQFSSVVRLSIPALFLDPSSKSYFTIEYLGPAVNLTPLFGEGYNDWVAFMILFVCIIFALNLHGKLLRLCNINNYFYENIKENATDVEDGRQILELARTAELRRLQREDRSGRLADLPRARNTAELLARYRERGVDVGPSASKTIPANSSSKSNVSSSAPDSVPPRSARIFGNKQTKNGYQSLLG
ncbi:LMBR1 domain-containing protein 2 [Boothiomyces sp. JEL0866]|nr:LMBR1 domain-containing protein 2 [Boothiomyces sp. JEL0866]